MATRSTTSNYMPPPPGKVLFAGGMFNNIITLGAPRGSTNPAPNSSGARINGQNLAFVVVQPIIG